MSKKLSLILLALSIVGASRASILVQSQHLYSSVQGFAADPGGFSSYNQNFTDPVVHSGAASISDFTTATTASVASSAHNSLTYSTFSPNVVEFYSEDEYLCSGSGIGTNLTAGATGHTQLDLVFSGLTSYDISVQITDVGNGGFTLYGGPSIGVGFGMGVGTYHLTGVLYAGSYFWDMNGSVQDSTGGSPFSHRAQMLVNARFVAVPEPTSLAVLGLGMLALLRRKTRP